MKIDYDPMSPRWLDDPYPIYRELRDRAPVHWAESSRAFCVSRFEDVQRVLTDAETFSSQAMFTVIMNGGQEGMPPLDWQTLKATVRLSLAGRVGPWAFANARNIIAADGDVHTGMRNIVNRGFTPRRIRDLEPRVTALVEQCLARWDGDRTFDVVRGLAIPLPVTMIAEMLGVEPERQEDFKKWSNAIIHYATGSGRADRYAPAFVDALVGLIRYIRSVAQERRRQPANDLVSALVSSQEGEDGLSDMETTMFVNLLLVAGNETTTNLIGNATHALLDHAGELERVVADPSLIPSLVEEAVRFDSPVQVVFRHTTCETEIAGTRLPRGSLVAPLIGSANRDERRFDDPDRFDVGRNPQGHLGFGFGKHFCLGAALARLEATAALTHLVPRLPGCRRAADKLERIDSFLVRGPKRLELAPAA